MGRSAYDMGTWYMDPQVQGIRLRVSRVRGSGFEGGFMIPRLRRPSRVDQIVPTGRVPDPAWRSVGLPSAGSGWG